MGPSLRRVVGLLSGLAALIAIVEPAAAVVQTTGSVLLSPDSDVMNGAYSGLYADNPFTTTINEGIPTNGNRIDPFRAPTSQIEFEGRPITASNTNVNFSVIVGRSSFGELIVNQSQLRDMDLVIGDQAQVGTVLQRGTGVVRIEGFGSLYNNNPFILPYLGGDPDTAVSPSVVPRPDTVGYDLFVGRFGNGTLQLALGGRAEIQDAVLIGDQSGSNGTMVIDGIDSFLQSGGFQTDSTDPDEINYMIVGHLGTGKLTIQNGGQSLNLGPVPTSGTEEQWAAVIGSNEAADSNVAPGVGGNGTVEVIGPGSAWTVAGNLQVGGFHNNRIGIGPLSQEDLEGELAVYGPGVGRGTLRVATGGVVNIVTPPLDATASNVPDRLDFLVGRFGRVELSGGSIYLIGAFDDTDPQNPTQELTRGRLINDGVVEGSGTISVLQFRNRVTGELRVNPGQSMILAATGEYVQPDNVPLPTEAEEYPLSNYGLVKVTGTPEAPATLEIQRNLVTLPTPPNQTRPFLNLPIPVPPGAPNGRTGGEIVASNSNMHFDSDLINRHKLSFIGGDNLVTGNVDNEAGGTTFIGGDQTTVTFVDEFRNLGGTLSVQPNISLVMFLDNLTLGGAGSLSTTFGGRPTGQQISMLSSAEDIFLGGTLNATLFNENGFPTFSPQAGDQFAIINSATALVDDFDVVNLPDCIGGTLCFVGFKDDTLRSYFVRVFDLALALGGDLDGSGLVDDLDFEVWRQNLGNTAGPGIPLAGDADGDGIVDGDDFLVWQAQFGTPGMAVPGAGSGAGGLNGGYGAVPEPATAALVLAGSMLALAFARRRAI